MEQSVIGNKRRAVTVKSKLTKQTKTSENNFGRYHIINAYLKNPIDDISIALVGAGGNGSLMFTHLIKINNTLKALGRRPIKVTVYDNDVVTEANLGRQMFYEHELGMNKSEALVKRYHRAFGDLSWEYKNYLFEPCDNHIANIVLLCVDNVHTRLKMCEYKANRYLSAEHIFYYWIDIGNAFDHGQVILSNYKAVNYKNKHHVSILKTFVDIFGKNVPEEVNTPSCNLAEALGKQDLFCNPIISSYAAHYLWKLLSVDILYYQGIIVDIKNHNVCPIYI